MCGIKIHDMVVQNCVISVLKKLSREQEIKDEYSFLGTNVLAYVPDFKKKFSKFDKPLKDKKTVYEQPVWVIGRNKQYLVENTVSVVKVRSRKQKGFQYLLVITDISQSLLWQ